MYKERFNLSWDSHTTHLREMLHSMLRSNELTDVTLVCDDKTQFKAHKIVLSACSSVFRSIIIGLPQNNSVIYLKGINHQEMESILEFMYLGVATFYQERLNEFLNVAKSFEIKEMCKNTDLDCHENDVEPSVNTEESDLSTNINSKAEMMYDDNTTLDTSGMKSNKLSNKESKMMNYDETPVDTQELNLNLYSNKEGEMMNYDETPVNTQVLNLNKVSDRGAEMMNDAEIPVEIDNSELLKNSNYEEEMMNDAGTSEDTEESNLLKNSDSKEEIMNADKTVHMEESDILQNNDSLAKNSSKNIVLKTRSHKKKVDGMFLCDQCKTQFTTTRSLNRHIQSIHEGVKFDCDQCNYQATQLAGLKTHIMGKHEGTKFHCNTCGQQFSFQSSLNKHIKLNKCS